MAFSWWRFYVCWSVRLRFVRHENTDEFVVFTLKHAQNAILTSSKILLTWVIWRKTSHTNPMEGNKLFWTQSYRLLPSTFCSLFYWFEYHKDRIKWMWIPAFSFLFIGIIVSAIYAKAFFVFLCSAALYSFKSFIFVGCLLTLQTVHLWAFAE